VSDPPALPRGTQNSQGKRNQPGEESGDPRKQQSVACSGPKKRSNRSIVCERKSQLSFCSGFQPTKVADWKRLVHPVLLPQVRHRRTRDTRVQFHFVEKVARCKLDKDEGKQGDSQQHENTL